MQRMRGARGAVDYSCYGPVMIIAIVPIVAALIGLLTYVLAASPKASEIGRILFSCGVLVALFTAASHTIRLM